MRLILISKLILLLLLSILAIIPLIASTIPVSLITYLKYGKSYPFLIFAMAAGYGNRVLNQLEKSPY